MAKEQIGLKDKNGREICEGDIVEFVVSYDYSNPPKPTYDTADGTKMNDIVKIIDGVAYFWCEDVQNASFAWRHHSYCRVIGNIHDKHKMPNASNSATGDRGASPAKADGKT